MNASTEGRWCNPAVLVIHLINVGFCLDIWRVQKATQPPHDPWIIPPCCCFLPPISISILGLVAWFAIPCTAHPGMRNYLRAVAVYSAIGVAIYTGVPLVLGRFTHY